jgi:2OG-Fe(II) oxygenase superfamily
MSNRLPKGRAFNDAGHCSGNRFALLQDDAASPDMEVDLDKSDMSDVEGWSSNLLSFLDEIEPFGTFASCGLIDGVPPYYPKVSVDEVGPLGFPLMEVAVALLKAVAAKAPFGRGLDTLYDDSVRQAWQVDAGHVTLGGGDVWKTVLQGVVKRACHELGISKDRVKDRKVHANLYKLLLYESGGHFTPHRDTEKEDGMFGTLVIQLPSIFTGGDFSVQHEGESKTFALSENSDDELKYIAFFADCLHKLHTVTSGTRICLVYNLVAGEKSGSQSLSFSNNLATESKLRSFGDEWKANPDGRTKLGYHLGHKYTPKSFSISSMKGRDNILVQMLLAAKDVKGEPLFQIHLLLMNRYVHIQDDEIWEDEVSVCMVLDRNGTSIDRVAEKGFKMYKHSDGWLVCPEYYIRFNEVDRDTCEENDYKLCCQRERAASIGSMSESDESAESDEDSAESVIMPTKKIHAMFCGAASTKVYHEDHGNDGGYEEIFYYTAAVVLSPFAQA